MYSVEDFRKIYNDYFNIKFLSVAVDYEKKRKNILIKIVFFSLLFLILAVATAVVFLYLLFHGFYNQIIYALLLLFIYALLFRSLIYHLEVSREFENDLNENLLKYFLEPIANFKPWPHNHNIENIIDSEIFPNFVVQDDVKSYFGFYSRTGITITDTSLNIVTPMDRRALFKGAVVQLEMEKNINNHIIIQPFNCRKPNGFVKIPFENKYVSVFAKNKEINISFIDNELIQIFENLAQAFHAPTMRISIKNSIVVVSLPTKSSVFKLAGTYKPLTDIRAYDEILNKFISIFRLTEKITMQI